MRLKVLHDVSVVAPVVDESELEYRCVDTTERENILVNQPIPDGREPPKDVFCFLEILREVNAKGFEGDLLAVQRPPPNIGSPAGCNCDLSVPFKTLKRSGGVGDLPQRGHELGVFCEVGGRSLPKAVNAWSDRDRCGSGRVTTNST